MSFTAFKPLCGLHACLLLGVLTVGCNSGPKLVPVSGQVTVDGKPLKFGSIRFVPSGAPSAVSDLTPDGRFTLKTGDREGCVVGTHAVEVHATEPAGEYKNIQHAPVKYANVETSGLSINVDGPTTDLVIELDSKAKSPPPPKGV